MAKKQVRAGRTLVVFFLGVAIAFGLVALTGTWQPQLGLDLQGGTRITLQAKGNPSQANLDEARNIIDQRVNGSGVSEAEVTTQGGGVIVVEIPGSRRRDLIDVVERQAQLRFRLVACNEQTGCSVTAGSGPANIPPTAQPTPSVTGTPGASATRTPSAGSAPDSPAPQGTKTPGAGASSTAKPRVAPGFAQDTHRPAAKTTATPGAKATTTPSATATDPTASPTTNPSDSPTTPSATESPAVGADETGFDQNATAPLAEELAFIRGGITQADVDLFNTYACDADGNLVNASDNKLAALPDNPLKPLVACTPPEEDPTTGDTSPPVKYLLSKAIIEGTDLSGAGYSIPQGEVQYAVTLDLKGQGRSVFTQASTDLITDQEQFAIVLDGKVLSAPTFRGPITGGSAQISGSFTESQAKNLSTSLKYGALPLSFGQPSSDTIGPSLAGDQLKAGITAGLFGLILVMLYCLIYYRGLGLVVLSSLLVAAAITYAMVLLLSKTAGFTLTLPGIAGLIIAVGITADSFIIFFERIRDEMRDGKSMRVAVETGWKKARNTTLAADAVSLLAAVVLFIFASGVVKGFAFALGLTTVIDLVVFFYFTKPMVSYLARYRFFNKGHRLSGLSAETLGMDRFPAGGKA